jgi:hypothetical protein
MQNLISHEPVPEEIHLRHGLSKVIEAVHVLYGIEITFAKHSTLLPVSAHADPNLWKLKQIKFV